ncbi:MAG TPA: glycosyltransferase [Candidatus Cloacimonadota bacterium]|nr:glycosyltransferase [Candidatus Cloacimonadota bacterium]
MRILVFSSSFPNPAEPINGSFVCKTLQAFPAEHELVVVAPVPFGLAARRGYKESIPVEEEVELGADLVKVYRPRYLLLPYNLLRPFIGFIMFLLCYGLVSRICKEKHIDLIHVHFAYPDGIAVSMISSLLKIPYLITEHRGLLRETLRNPWISSQLKTAYRKATEVVAVSDFNSTVLSSYSIKAKVIPNGIDFEHFTVNPAREHPSRLVLIANLIPAKGIECLIEAISLLRNRGKHYSLDIIGSGKYRSSLEKKVQALKLDQEINFLGQLPPSRVEELLPRYDSLVVSSLRESFSVVIVEAMASGLPVIATRCGGPEAIVQAETGILVQPASAEALFQGILELESKWESYDPYIIREFARDKYSLDGVMQSYLELYKSILGSNSAK